MDDVDITQARIEMILEAGIEDVRKMAAEMPLGEPGECGLCGEWSGRLVRGACAPCRDKRKLG